MAGHHCHPEPFLLRAVLRSEFTCSSSPRLAPPVFTGIIKHSLAFEQTSGSAVYKVLGLKAAISGSGNSLVGSHGERATCVHSRLLGMHPKERSQARNRDRVGEKSKWEQSCGGFIIWGKANTKTEVFL